MSSKIHPINTGNSKSPYFTPSKSIKNLNNDSLSVDDINYMVDKKIIVRSVGKKLKKHIGNSKEQSNILNNYNDRKAMDKADAEACDRDCRGPICIAKAMCCAAGIACLIGSTCGLGRKNKKCKKKYTKKRGNKKGKRKTKGGRKNKKRTRRRRSRRTKRRRTRK